MNRLSHILVVVVILLPQLSTAQTPASNDWENPQVNSAGRIHAHTYSRPLQSEKSAFTAALEPFTPYVKSLNGDWKISWCGDPARRPKNFYKVDYDDSQWQLIDVPSCVEMRGFGQPGYTNVKYPHAAEMPYIKDYSLKTADYNPVSSYRTEFIVPEDFKGRDVILRFDGVYSAYYVWINGEKVGYAEDSKLPSEFNITKNLKPGKNLLAVEVYRWCDGSYLEDQDMFRFSGIFRDVTLIAVPKQPIEDFYVRTSLTNNYQDARIQLSVKSQAKNVSAQLYDAKGKLVGKFKGPESILNIKKANLWSAENPYLYTLVIKAGQDIRSAKVGIKQVEIKDNAVCINGKLVKFKGVNRHEHSAKNGRTVTEQEMLEDILLMKRFNINTVRTSHYPNHHLWYDLCDKYGLYVCAEANVEGHGYYGNKDEDKNLGQLPDWEKSIVERNVNHVYSYRNHPSVVIWSLGNETAHGQNFVKARDAIKNIDTTRPVHWCEGNEIADVDSKMYPDVEWLYNRGKVEKPFFLCEYAHAMGNAVGNLKEYWEAFYSSDHLSGGCIWDWVDQALEKNTNRFDSQGNPVKILAYGGDFDETPNDGPFCCNGLVRPNRKVSAKLIEVGHVYQQIVVTSDDASQGKAQVWNRFSFTDTNAYDVFWALLEDGEKVAEGKWEMPNVKPDEKLELALPKPNVDTKPGKEYFMNISFRLKENTLWAEKGHTIASDQLAYGKSSQFQATASLIKEEPSFSENEKEIVITSAVYKAIFCKKTCSLVSLQLNGKRILASQLKTVAGPRLTCMRALVDNDQWINGWKAERNIRVHGLTILNHQAKDIKVSKQGDNSVQVKTTIDVTGAKSAGFDHLVTWTFCTDGTITMKNDIHPYGNMPTVLPRLGLSLLLDKSLEQVEWYGRGPAENYIDRQSGSFIGKYASTVTDQYEDYVRPQDNGYKSDVRWFALKDSQGKGVKFSADVPLFVQALHYDWEDLMYARHRNGEERRNEMKSPREEVCLNLDIRQLGLGGASCGPAPMDKYIFPIQDETYTITIAPTR